MFEILIMINSSYPRQTDVMSKFDDHVPKFFVNKTSMFYLEKHEQLIECKYLFNDYSIRQPCLISLTA